MNIRSKKLDTTQNGFARRETTLREEQLSLPLPPSMADRYGANWGEEEDAGATKLIHAVKEIWMFRGEAKVES